MNEPVRVIPIYDDASEASAEAKMMFWSADRMSFGQSTPGDPVRGPARLARWRGSRAVSGTSA